jgi:DNA-binding CsgD family transcriptional regulator
VKTDAIAIVEAAYDPEGDDDAWFGRVVDSTTPLLDRGLGVLAWRYEVTESARMRIWSSRYAGGSVAQAARMLEGLGGATAEMTPEQNRMAYVESAPVNTVSGMYGGAPRDQPRFGHHLASMGVHDMLVVLSRNPSRYGCVFASALPEVRSPSASDMRTWTRIAAHVAAGCRLRHEVADEGDAAVLAPNGRVEHAEGDAQAKSAREALRDAALRIDRARSKSRGDPDEALSLWQGLIAGRWSLVDRFDSDGKRYLVARRNAPHVSDPRALTLRERQVLAYLAMGHPHKLIAYSLGISVAAVSAHRTSAIRKLGLRTHAEIVQLFAPTVPEDDG